MALRSVRLPLWLHPPPWLCPAVLASVTLLSGCRPPDGSALTLQAAVTVTAHAQAQGARVLAGPRIHLMQPTPAGTTAVVYSYTTDEDGRHMRMTAFTQFARRGLGWGPVGSGGAGGGPVALPRDALEDLRGGGEDDPQRLAYAYGRIHDPRIARVQVTFADGTQLEAALGQGAYLAIAQGTGAVVTVKAVADDGRILMIR